MATTTNYGWSTPDDTALVSQGAAAIRTLGSSVDTTVKALSPGTTAGDIDYYTSSTAKARLAIGTTGQILSVSAGVPSWATPASSGGMTLLSTTTLSGTSTTISSISQSYTDLQVILAGITFASNTNIYARWNNDTSNSIVSGYSSYSGGSFRAVDGQLASTGVTTHNAILYMAGYSSTTYTKNGFGNETMAGYPMPLGFWYNATTAISSLTIATSGNSFTGGTCLIYGVK
jgi:hypothetical protein